MNIDPRLPIVTEDKGYKSLLNVRLYELFRDLFSRISALENGMGNVTLADGAQLDGFSRLRVSNPKTLFDSQQEYGLDTLRTWDATANGTLATGSSNGSVTNGSNAVGPRSTNTRMTPITVSSTNGHYSILQSKQYCRYIPGKSHLVFMTGIFAHASNATSSICLRTSTSGSVADNEVVQTSWNLDKMNGKGPSGITIDFTKTQILVIDAQWLGVGRVRVGFDVAGCICWAHEFKNANIQTVPYTQTFNLPVRFEGRTDATNTIFRTGYFEESNGVFLKTSSTTKGGTSQFVCSSVQSEGGEEARGFPWAASNGVTRIGVTTRRPVISIRPKTTFNGITNRSHIELADFLISAKTNDAFYEIVIGGTLTGASFASVNADSTAEYDISATAISGGRVIKAGSAPSGSGVQTSISSGDIDIRNPLVLSQIDGLSSTQVPITIVCTSESGTSNISSTINWHEQVI